ncbi:MAG: PAS domain S-box protein [Rhodocyclaceae bacterium]|nr:PAS domain S-box protein [Rhodocyclaceae bacterium]
MKSNAAISETKTPGGDFHDAILRDENTLRLLRMIIGLIISGCLVYLAAMPLSIESATIRGPGLVAMSVCAATAWMLLRRGKVGLAVSLLIWGVWTAMLLQIGITNGLMSRSLIGLPILVVLAGWLLPPRGAIAFCVATILAGLGLALAEQMGALPLYVTPSPPFLVWVAVTIYVMLAAAVAYHIFRGFRLRHEAMRKINLELSTQIDHLSTREAELRLLMESVPVMLFHGDREQRCLHANRNYANFYSQGRDDIIGLSVREIIGEEAYGNGVGEILGRVLAGERLAYRAQRRSAAGESRVLDIEIVPEPGEEGRPRGLFAIFKDVTQQVAIEAELRRSESKFSSVFRSSPLATAITRLEDGRYIDINEAFERLFGWTRDEIIGRTSLDIGKWLSPEARENWAAALQKAGRINNLEVSFRVKNGEIREVLLSSEIIDLEGEPCALVMVADITDRRRAEQSLQESEARLRIATSGGGVGIWEWDIASNRLEWNEQLKVIFGLPISTDNLSLERFLGAILPEDSPRVQQSYMNALEHHCEFDCEYRIVRPDGSVRWIVARGHGQYGNDGKPFRMAGMAIDTTERKRAEEKFAKVFQASPVAISISRLRDGHYLDVNEAFVGQFGWSREEMIGRTSVEIGLWPNETARKLWATEMRKSGRVRSYEAKLVVKSGAQRTVLISAEQFGIDGEVCVIGIVHDITELRQAEGALRESEARLREAQRIGQVGSWDLDIVAKRMTWSDEVFRIFERPPGSFGGTFQDLLSMVHPEDVASMQQTYRSFAGPPGNYGFRHRILTPDGRVKHIHARWEVFVDKEGKPSRALGTAQDITAQVLANEEIHHLNAELEIRVQERTAELQSANKELESFAYSISHDLRAPLRGIDGFSHLLAEEYGERLDAQGKSYLERVRAAAQRMGHLIDDILELSRVSRHSMRRSQVDLSRLAGEILDELRQGAPARAPTVSIAEGCTAFGDPQLLRVLMQNLLENAWKYSSREAAPTIEFGRETPDGEAVFFVRDNGVGFDMKYADRLFTPFQRLHKPEEFEGTGIGLATVARIVHRHGGRVWAESEPGKGTTIRFTLPH